MLIILDNKTKSKFVCYYNRILPDEIVDKVFLHKINYNKWAFEKWSLNFCLVVLLMFLIIKAISKDKNLNLGQAKLWNKKVSIQNLLENANERDKIRLTVYFK